MDQIKSPRKLLVDAAKNGNVHFLSILIREYPDLLSLADEETNYTIYHIGVLNRQEDIFKLVYEIHSNKDLILDTTDKQGNNILHLAGKMAPQDRLNVVPGAVLQMQRELLWFQQVEKAVPPRFAQARNEEGLTPKDLFSKEHRSLKEEGEKWMKETASSCMIVATLIATIVFAAIITVPGGNKEDTGLPFFKRRAAFKIFAVSDVISLVSSSISIVNFLSIISPRYAEEDFLKILPRKFMVGLAALFISITAMMFVFSSTTFILYKEIISSRKVTGVFSTKKGKQVKIIIIIIRSYSMEILQFNALVAQMSKFEARRLKKLLSNLLRGSSVGTALRSLHMFTVCLFGFSTI